MVDITKAYLNDNNELCIEASVKSDSYYTNVYIDSVLIDTQDTFISTGPSENTVYRKTLSGNKKEVSLIIKETDTLTTFGDNLLIIYIVTKGIPSSDVPCGKDNTTVSTAVFDTRSAICGILKSLKQEISSCVPPRFFINDYMKYKAIQLSIINKDYITAVEYYNNFFKENKAPSFTKHCKCHG
jgi:hypothetical protein